jgi:hypothetical protein
MLDSDWSTRKPAARIVKLKPVAWHASARGPRRAQMLHAPTPPLVVPQRRSGLETFAPEIRDPGERALASGGCWLPDIVRAILNGKQPPELTARKLLNDMRLPLDWNEQRRSLGFA